MKKRRVSLVMPDLGIDDQPATLSLWFAKRGQRVHQGEPLAEILCGPVTIDLPAPTDGVLVEKSVVVDEELRAGQILAVVAEA
jgi:pyruvate/2-oxoglutarate dehydrogenase complex dihydrolipoamide acyltransferase (E2) component